MEKINAVITGVGGYVPEYVLNNDELSRMVDTTDEWITTRVGIKERHILTEEGLGTSYMARKAVKQLLEKTGTDPQEVDCVIIATTTPDYHFPSTSSIVVGRLGMKNAFAIDMQAACCGFLFAMDAASGMIQSGRYKKIVVFGDGAAAVMLEPSLEEGMGWQDSFLRADGKGLPFLCLKAGGSVCSPSYFTIDHRMHYLHQEGRTVFKFAVTNMSDACALIAERNHLDKDNIAWVIPHQANVRIIEAVAHRLELSMDKVMLNIQRYGNTSAGTLPLALWDYEKQLKKGDNLILTAFGAGFTWGAAYVKWAYDGSK